VGDCLIAAAFLCFMGPYPNDYRIEINKAVMEFVKHSKIVKYSTNFTFEGFMTSPPRSVNGKSKNYQLTISQLKMLS